MCEQGWGGWVVVGRGCEVGGWLCGLIFFFVCVGEDIGGRWWGGGG